MVNIVINFTKDLYLYFGIETFFKVLVPWYFVTVKNESLFFFTTTKQRIIHVAELFEYFRSYASDIAKFNF